MSKKKMKNREVRKSRKSLSYEEIINIAITRFSGRPFKSIHELALEFGRDPAVISRAISKAFKDGLVQVTASKQHSKQPVRSHDLERQLLDRFHKLSSCIVIENQSSTTSEKENDELHKELGKAMSSLIATGSLFRDGDLIGLGSGRGVYHTIKELAVSPPLRAKVSLISLTGATFARDHSERINLLLDADTHLGLLGPCFGRPVTIHPLSHPIVYTDQNRQAEIIKNTSLGKGEWEKKPATHALIGVGVLAKGHRFYKEAKADEKSRSIILRPIYRFLDPLVKLCEEVEAQFSGRYYPVADICNRLFYVPPPDGLEISESTQKQIKERAKAQIAEINDRLVTISDEQLKQIDTIILVAGTRQKASAIQHLLSADYSVRFLCLDQTAAEEILRNP